MPNWKKVIVSGSDAELNNITSSGAITAGGLVQGDYLQFEGYGTVIKQLNSTTHMINNWDGNGNLALSSYPNKKLGLFTDGAYTGTPALVVTGSTAAIGTETFQSGYTLSVGGKIYASSEIRSADKVGVTSGTYLNNNSIYSPYAFSLNLYHSSDSTRTQQYWNNDNRYTSIGVGQTSPSASLDVYSEDGNVFLARSLDGGNSLFYISGSGNIGIGTTSPSTELHVVGTISASKFETEGQISASLFSGSFVGDGSGLTGISAGGGGIFAQTGSYYSTTNNLQITGSLELYKSGSTVFNIEGSQGTLFSVTDELSGSLFSVNDISGIPIFEVFSDDTVKIGTYNAEAIIVNGSSAIASGSFSGSFQGDGSNLTGIFTLANDANNRIITATGTNSGNGEANLTFDGSELGLAGDLAMTGGSIGVGVTPNATAGRIDASNDIVAYSSSDKRWKTNIKTIESPLDKLQKLSGVEFDCIEDTELHGNSGNDVGVIAQEVEEVLPQAVQTRDSGMKAVRYEKLIPLLIETIKEQQHQIDELKSKIG